MFGTKSKKTLIISLLLTFLFTAKFVYAQDVSIKDSDLDGISDTAEVNIYKTDPNNPDTDGDGVLDYKEVLEGTNPVDATSSNLADALNKGNQLLPKDAPIMWYVGRISGISSFIMFTVVIVFGLLMTSKILLKFRYIFPSDALSTHMFTATYIAFVLLLLHIGAFIFDDYIQLKPAEIFVPFLLKRDLYSSLNFNLGVPVALGVIALYLAILLLVTSHLRNKIVNIKVWRKIHYSSFLFYILFLIHAITAGTDATEGWMIAIYAISVVLVVGLILLRIFGKKYFLPVKKDKNTNLSNTHLDQ